MPAPKQKRSARPRFNPVTVTYLALVQQLEQRRRELGWSHLRLCDEANIGRGHWAHYLNPDRASGRVMVWATLDKVFGALYPHGFHIVPAERLRLATVSIESRPVGTLGVQVAHGAVADDRR